MRCEDAQILLSTRRDLNRSQRVELEAHLGSCRACVASARAEERVSRLLAALPDPGLTAPPRVAAAIAARAAKRGVAARRRRGLVLAATLGATVVFAAMLLNIAAGGRLGWLLFGRPAAQETAGEPGASLASPGAPVDDLLYLVHRVGRGATLLAWRPADDKMVFRVPLGEPPAHFVVGESGPGGRFEVQAPPRDIALTSDGSRLYVIEYGPEGAALVAYDTRLGAEFWRTELEGYEPLITFELTGNLSVSPDGARVFVRGILSSRGPVDRPAELGLRAYAAADGRPLGEATRIPSEASVLPLSQHEIMAYQRGGGVARVVLGVEGPWSYLNQSIDAPMLLPNWRTVRGVTPDLKVVDLTLVGPELRVSDEIDLVERGGFFFTHGAFSPDGATLAVVNSTWDAQSGAVGSEIRIYRAEPWREIARYTVDRPTTEVVMSADGKRAYVALGQAGLSQRGPASQARPTPTPSLPLTEVATYRGALLTIETASGRLVRSQPLDLGIVSIVGAR